MTQRSLTCPYCGAMIFLQESVQRPVLEQSPMAPYRGGGATPAIPSIGIQVMGRWTNGKWYPGKIDDMRGDLIHIAFDDGDRLWTESDGVITEDDPMDTMALSWRVGMKVTGRWSDRRWYPGTLDKRFGRLWHVRFDDGDQAWLEADRIRAKEASEPGSSEGPKVMARWSNGHWYRGTIDRERFGLMHIAFDDGDKVWAEPSEVTRESDPPDHEAERLHLGARVRGEWSKDSWYRGKLDDRFGRIWHITFDDGDQAWLDASKIEPPVK